MMTRKNLSPTAKRQATIMRRRLIALVDTLGPGSVAEAIHWYADAAEHIRATAELTGRKVSDVAGAFAVLSPQVAWSYQLSTTALWIAGNGSGTHAGYGANVAKARKILSGAAASDVVRGPKVTSFWRNLQGDLSTVTLDRHAIDAARDRRGSSETQTLRVTERRAMDVAYREAASALGLEPAELQAAVWVAWRTQNKIRN